MRWVLKNSILDFISFKFSTFDEKDGNLKLHVCSLCAEDVEKKWKAE